LHFTPLITAQKINQKEVYMGLKFFAVLSSLANIVTAIYTVYYVRKAITLLGHIDRSTRVVKTDLILKRAAEAKSSAERRRIETAVEEEKKSLEADNKSTMAQFGL
jgi:hypothetical protein